jgi:hypothetical protein
MRLELICLPDTGSPLYGYGMVMVIGKYGKAVALDLYIGRRRVPNASLYIWSIRERCLRGNMEAGRQSIVMSDPSAKMLLITAWPMKSRREVIAWC